MFPAHLHAQPAHASLDGRTLGEAVAALSTWMTNGSIRPPDHQITPLHEAARAHRLIKQGGVKGQVLLLSSQSRAA